MYKITINGPESHHIIARHVCTQHALNDAAFIIVPGEENTISYSTDLALHENRRRLLIAINNTIEEHGHKPVFWVLTDHNGDTFAASDIDDAIEAADLGGHMPESIVQVVASDAGEARLLNDSVFVGESDNVDEMPLERFGFEVPAWLEQDISAYTVKSIAQGGCDSGAYMPAVTNYQALATMGEHGDDVLEYLENNDFEPDADTIKGSSWSGLACYFLSAAVETWANSIEGEL